MFRQFLSVFPPAVLGHYQAFSVFVKHGEKPCTVVQL